GNRIPGPGEHAEKRTGHAERAREREANEQASIKESGEERERERERGIRKTRSVASSGFQRRQQLTVPYRSSGRLHPDADPVLCHLRHRGLLNAVSFHAVAFSLLIPYFLTFSL